MAGDHSKYGLRGRRRECETLDRLLEDAKAGKSRVLVLRGEAGIGKSALLDYLDERASAYRVERAFGIESEMELAFAGLHQLCASMVENFDRLPDPQRGALATIFGLEAGAPPGQFLLGLSLLGLLSDVAEGGPLVCIVDDAQWLDGATEATLAFAARRLFAESVALVFAVREPAPEPTLAGLPELRIDGLGTDDALSLLDVATAGRLDERVRDRIVAEARGNPLALLELPRGLTAAELELGIGQHDSIAIASRVEQSYLRQLQQLPTDTRTLLLAAAVEPLGDATLLWRATTHLGTSIDAAAPAEEAGLVTFGPRVRFRHPLVRSAVCRTAGVHDLRDVHRALAEATDADLDPDRHAWHRAYAAAEPDEAVVAELEQAAERAQQRGATVTAAAFLERATELTADPDRRGQRALTAAVAKVFAAEFDSGLELLATAELCPLDPLQRAWLLRLRASMPSNLAGVQERPAMFLEAAELFHPLDARIAREVYLGALGTQMMVGRLADEQVLREVAGAARAAPPAPDPPRPIDLVLDALAVRFCDGHEAALEPMRRAVHTATRVSHDDEILQWLFFGPPVAPEVWDDESWDVLTAHVVQSNRDSGAFGMLPLSLQYRAEFELNAGHLEAAAELLDENDTILELTARQFMTYTALEYAAWRGDEARALNVIDSATREMLEAGTGRIIGIAEYAKAVLANGLGQYGDALDAAQRACAYDDLGVFGRSLVERIEAGSRCDASADAALALEELERRTLGAGTDWALGMLARSRALLSDAGRAEPLYREAIERLERTRMTAHLARAHLVYGEWLRRAQRRVDAREQLRRAHEMLTAMGASAFAERARRELVATGETVRKRSVDTSDALTPQEAQIARLAADGESNPEIGSRLFISARTVEYHLTKVFVKLGVKSRRELRGALR
jgi:DNA-binding CsgD family transcriptional regulator/tetratricopeptide (TPR) repeat protein